MAIDDDIFAIVRKRAESRRESLGRVLSELARKGLSYEKVTLGKNEEGFPVFVTGKEARNFDDETVRKALEEEDEETLRR